MANQPSTKVEDRSYTVEEVGEVIRTASALARREDQSLATTPTVSEGLGYGELVEMAREMGIPIDLLRKAIPEADQRRKRALKRTRRKMRFWRHLLTATFLTGGLAALDFLAGPGWWVHWLAIPWGTLVAMHGSRTFFTGKGAALHEAVYRAELEAEKNNP